MDAGVLFLNLAVLILVLSTDMGHRKIGAVRLLRPVVGVAIVIPFFVEGATWSGHGLLLELAGLVSGIALGGLAGALFRVSYDAEKGRAVSVAGWPYAAVWVVISAARIYFTYGANHVFSHQLGVWMFTNHINKGAIADSLIFMSLAMLLTRTVILAVQARAATGRAARAFQLQPGQVPADKPTARR